MSKAIEHIYLSEGVSTVGKKIQLDSITEIEWTEQISCTLEME